MCIYDDYPNIFDDNDIIDVESPKTIVQIAYRGDALTEDEKELLKSFIYPGIDIQIHDSDASEGLYKLWYKSYEFAWEDDIINADDILFLYERIIYIKITRNLYEKDTKIFYPLRYSYIPTTPRRLLNRLFAYNRSHNNLCNRYRSNTFDVGCYFLESIASLFLFNPQYVGELSKNDAKRTRPYRLSSKEWYSKLERIVNENNEDFRVVRINQTHYVEIKNLSQVKEMIKEDKSSDKFDYYYYPVISYPDTDIHYIYLAIKNKKNTDNSPLQENMIVYAFIDSFNPLY